MIIPVEIEKVKPNPWQPRKVINQERIESLAADIRERGMIQTPIGRKVPLNGEVHVELAFGHRRFAAWQIAFPDQPFPVRLEELTNKQMMEHAIVENGQRDDISAIEKAQALQQYIAETGATQAQAGALLGIKQAAVSNLLRLLRLPQDVQALVTAGTLPERFARRLIPLAEAATPDVVKLAGAIAVAGDDQRENIAHRGMWDILWRKVGQPMRPCDGCYWPPDWKPDISAEIQEIGVRACKGCPNQMICNRVDFCLKKTCFTAKQQLWQERELARLAEKLGIQVATADDQVTVLKIDYRNEDKAKRLLKRKRSRANLRLLPAGKYGAGNVHHYHPGVTGSRVVLLGSTDPDILKRDESVPARRPDETPEERQARIEAEEAAIQARREAKAELRKAQHDIAWLVFNTAERLEKRLDIAGGVLDYTLDLCNWRTSTPSQTWNVYTDKLMTLKDRLKKRKKEPWAGSPDPYKRQLILVLEFASAISAYSPQEQFNWTRALMQVRNVALKKFKIEHLPDGWDQPPVHRTRTNCHVCGKFTSLADRITKIEEAQGWQVIDYVVTCSDECRAKRGLRDPLKEYLAEWAKLSPQIDEIKAQANGHPRARDIFHQFTALKERVDFLANKREEPWTIEFKEALAACERELKQLAGDTETP